MIVINFHKPVPSSITVVLSETTRTLSKTVIGLKSEVVMLGTAINTIGLCIIGGKYILILILAALTLSSGSISPEFLTFSLTGTSE